MALQGDQRALLQLLCERDQSYADISGLLGTSPEDVRARARAGLTEIGGSDPDAEVALTDYLLGQADPIGRADAVRHLQSDPGALALATRIEDGLREIAPKAKLPKLPEPRGRTRRAAVPTGTAEEASRDADPAEARAGSTTTSRQTRTIAALAAAGVILLVGILALTGTFDSDDGGSATTASADGTATDGEVATENVTEVNLKPSGDSGVAGDATFGLANQSQLYIDLTLDGLDPSPAEDATYFLWLMLGDAGGYPISQALEPDENGRFSGRIAVPSAVAQTLAPQARSVRISLSPIDELGKAARQAAKDQVPIVPFTGEQLATGKIPLAEPDQQGE